VPPVLALFSAVFDGWSAAYSDSSWLQTLVAFFHFGGILAAGGLAIATDRSTLRVSRAATALQLRHLSEVHNLHRVVLAGLAVTMISGLAMFAADIGTFVVSPVFWTKLGLVALLLWNGFGMMRTEKALRQAKVSPGRAWMRLKSHAVVSGFLWFGVVLAGTALGNFS